MLFLCNQMIFVVCKPLRVHLHSSEEDISLQAEHLRYWLSMLNLVTITLISTTLIG